MQRMSRLDGLRGVLAVYVMVCHALPYAAVPPALAAPFYHGQAVVDLFFALSGMVVIHSLERFQDRFWPFLRGRASRLLPVYFAVLVPATLLLCAGSPLPAMPWIAPHSAAWLFWSRDAGARFFWQVMAHVLLLQGVLPQGVLPWAWITVLGPAWSLSTEWQFYVVMALVMLRFKGRNRLLWFAGALLALGAGYAVLAPRLPGQWQFSRAFLPDAAPYFALGLVSTVGMRSGRWLPFALCLAVVCALGLASGNPARSLIALVWGVFLLAQRHPAMPVLPRLLDSRLGQYLGRISYPLYLVNQPLQRGAAMLLAPLAHGSAVLFTLIWLPVALLGPVFAAMVLHHCVETPAMQPLARKRYAAALAKAGG